MPDAPLSSKARARLRAQAHALKPLLHIGKEGVSDAAVAAAREAFHTRELLKVRVLDAAPEAPRETASALAARIEDVVVVQVVGRTVTLYRPQRETPPAKPERRVSGSASRPRRSRRG